MIKQKCCLEKEIMQRTMPGACRRGRPPTAWMDNINTWTGFPVTESIRMTEDRDKWGKYVHGVRPRTAKEQNRTTFVSGCTQDWTVPLTKNVRRQSGQVSQCPSTHPTDTRGKSFM